MLTFLKKDVGTRERKEEKENENSFSNNSMWNDGMYATIITYRLDF